MMIKNECQDLYVLKMFISIVFSFFSFSLLNSLNICDVSVRAYNIYF